ncbi:Arc family DNA binding domain-containing protein [Pedobacter gandavensis]|uniref:Arc family DNA binding domain-containing protein n=1 Tax=Pedobacter gandavensis TaxID=2679963 RepID=A0ABR6EW17_9SPHI|nr:Arc family DNA binding domain-containing protein [Pedobacter gandavensis]MBB2148979.1 Arc family DNA binding domain-containing protein [Pedobacter gandavensis]
MSEKDKKAFALRINPALLKEIENWAADEFRSINGQIEYLLNEAVKSKRKRRINKNDTDEPR